MSSTVGAAVADTPTSAADNDFASYVPKTAFLFPGQGAQTVGMAKVSASSDTALQAAEQHARVRAPLLRGSLHAAELKSTAWGRV